MAKSVVDVAIERLNAQIADLQRAKDLILAAADDALPTEAPKKRWRKPKGLPAAVADI